MKNFSETLERVDGLSTKVHNAKVSLTALLKKLNQYGDEKGGLGDPHATT